MQHLLTIVVYTSLAGLALPLGGALASIERLRPRWLEEEFRHGVLAFGGGILLAAVALVLVPHGMRELDVAVAGLPEDAAGKQRIQHRCTGIERYVALARVHRRGEDCCGARDPGGPGIRGRLRFARRRILAI